MTKIKSILFNRTTYLTSFFLLLLLVATPVAFAATPNIVSGGQKLATDALTWILILVPVTAALWIGYHAWMKSMADGDPGAVAERNKAMKRVLIGSAIAECAGGLVTLFLSYFTPAG
jgi:hypothetical protein